MASNNNNKKSTLTGRRRVRPKFAQDPRKTGTVKTEISGATITTPRMKVKTRPRVIEPLSVLQKKQAARLKKQAEARKKESAGFKKIGGRRKGFK